MYGGIYACVPINTCDQNIENLLTDELKLLQELDESQQCEPYVL